MTFRSIYKNLTIGSVVALTAAVGTASGVQYRLTNPGDWANGGGNERAPSGDPTTGTVNGDSWVSDPSVTTDGNQHFIYFQGGTDSQDPETANPNNGTNPQLLFDSSNDDDEAETQVTVGEIARVAWDTHRSSQSTTNANWFFSVFTKDASDDEGAVNSYYGYNISFAYTQNTGYAEDNWNTLEANQDGNTSPGGLEVNVYDQRRIDSGNQGGSQDDRDEFESKTLSQWANGDQQPGWWDEEIRFAAMATGTNYNEGSSTFISNLDNFQFDYAAEGASDQVAIDLGVDSAASVPEPSSIALLGIGAGGLLLSRRRRERSRAELA